MHKYNQLSLSSKAKVKALAYAITVIFTVCFISMVGVGISLL